MKPLWTAALAATMLGFGAAPTEARILLPTLGQARGITVRAADVTVRTTRNRPNGFVAYRVDRCRRSGLYDVMCSFTMWQRPQPQSYVPCSWTSRVHYGVKRLAGFVAVRPRFWRLILPGDCFSAAATTRLPAGAQVPPT